VTERRHELKRLVDFALEAIAAGKLYLSLILDLYDHVIISCNISSSADFKQTVDMLDQAFAGHTKK
jgi:putative transposase